MYHIFSNKNGVLYFRYVLPVAVKKYFPRLQLSYNRSLRTAYRREAKIRAVRLYSDIHNTLENAMSLVDDLCQQIENLKGQVIFKVLDVAPSENRSISSAEMDEISPIKELRESLSWLYERKLIDELKPQNLVDVLTLYIQYKPIYEKAESEVNTTKAQKEYESIRDKLFALQGLEPTIKPEESKPQSTKSQESLSPLLSKIIKQFCNERVKGSNWTPSTLEDHEASYNLFIEFVGDKPIDKITKEDIRDYKLALQTIPSNRNKKKIYKEKSVHELVKLQLPQKDLLSIRSINKKLTQLSSLFNWSVRQGYCDRNLAEKMTIKQNGKASEEREIFTDADLHEIFTTEIFTRRNRKHNYYFWLPLLSLHTGGRINELSQLYKEDIYEIDDIWVIDFNDNTEDKRLKSKNAKRIVPVHKMLIATGFVKFADSASNERLFPEITYSPKNGYGHQPSNWFQRYRKKLNLEGKKAFHSFRHNFADALKQKGISESVAAALLGHEHDGISYGRYGKDYQVKKLKTEIDKIRFERKTPVNRIYHEA